MPTLKQKRVAKLIVENQTLDNPLTNGEIVESSGYGVSMKKNSHVVIESEGVKEALNDYGFNEDSAKQVVASILHDETKDANSRLKASDMIFKVHGTYAPDKHVSLNLNQDVESEELIDLAKTINELKRNNTSNDLTGDGTISSPVDREI